MAADQFLHDHRNDGPVALQPNKRLKLSAPALNRSPMTANLRCATVPFVNSYSLRRSLSAIR